MKLEDLTLASPPSKDKTLEDTIGRERARLEPIKEKSTLRIDTSDKSIHDLKRVLRKFLGENKSDTSDTKLRVNFLSFGYKYGLPLACDLVMDVRFLSNPHFVEGLRASTGKEQKVKDYVLGLENAQQFLENIKPCLNSCCPDTLMRESHILILVLAALEENIDLL